jgi:Flp pilus assembly protein TadG
VKRSRSRASHSGQVLLIFALALPALLGMMGLAVDGAIIYGQRRQMQSSADLAALSGALDLPTNSSAAVTAANSFAAQNGYTSGVTSVAPYGGNPARIQVSITRNVNTNFMRILGVNSVTVTARAVAVGEVGQGSNVAIFAGKNSCDLNAVDWSGSSGNVTGGVHSNSGFNMGGSGNRVRGETTYRQGCSSNLRTGDNTYDTAPATVNAARPWPVTFTTSQFPCTYTQSSGDFDLNGDGAWWANSSKTQLRPGIYCAPSGTVILSTSGVTGNVTFVGNRIDLAGSNNTLTPNHLGVLAFATASGSSAIKVAGSTNSWGGILYAPSGQVEMSGGINTTISGAIVADTVKLNGSSWSIVATVDAGDGRRRSHLIE